MEPKAMYKQTHGVFSNMSFALPRADRYTSSQEGAESASIMRAEDAQDCEAALFNSCFSFG
eukprot:4298473-Amphidinium_carterae.2